MQQEIISALCNPTRLRLISCISNSEKMVSELIDNCGLSQSAVSQHLVKLKKAGILRSRKIGREVHYSLMYKELAKLSKSILKISERS